MIVWRSKLFLSALLLAALSAPAAAATGEDPDWPCIQRLVPQIAPAAIWPGPDRAGERPGQPADRRACRRASARRVPMDEASAQIEAFAASLDDAQKNEQLIKLFVRTLEIINNDRSSIIEGTRNTRAASAPWRRASMRRTSV